MAIVGGWKLKYKKPRRARKKMQCYQGRNDRLGALGYAGYQDYLASDDWRKVREKVLARYPKCLVCSSPASQVHHLDYTYHTLLGLSRYGLVSLCSACHQQIEFDGDTKLPLNEANKKLRAMAHAAGKTRFLGSVKKERRCDMNKRRKQAEKVLGLKGKKQ